jgi:hypothetical protein
MIVGMMNDCWWKVNTPTVHMTTPMLIYRSIFYSAHPEILIIPIAAKPSNYTLKRCIRVKMARQKYDKEEEEKQQGES